MIGTRAFESHRAYGTYATHETYGDQLTLLGDRCFFLRCCHAESFRHTTPVGRIGFSEMADLQLNNVLRYPPHGVGDVFNQPGFFVGFH
jgi:hypothetical protein